jgi:hypothetical protein
MAKVNISPNRTTDKTIRKIDRKREQERKRMFHLAKEHATEFAAKLAQRVIDKNIIETVSMDSVREAFEKQLNILGYIDEFELQMKIAPIRTIAQDPNVVSLYFTQYIIEDLINNPAIQDVYGDDLEIYRVVDSVFKVLRP